MVQATYITYLIVMWFLNSLINHMIKLHVDSDFITCSIVKWTKFNYKIGCNITPTLLNKVNITTYFENITIKLYV